MSRTCTSWPSSAKQAAVTRPTQPAPITPMGSRAFMRRMTLQGLRGAGDVDHLPGRERLQQRVGHPVDRVLLPPCHQPQAVAVVEQLELAVAVLLRRGGVVEDRRMHPGRSLEAVVLAHEVPADDVAEARVAAALRPADLVRARRVDAEARARQRAGRVEDPYPADAVRDLQSLRPAGGCDVEHLRT